MWRLSVRWAYRTLLYSVATGLVLLALLLSGLRYLLPQLPDLTHQVEEVLASRYQVSANIAELSADWNTTGPQLVLYQVQLEPAAGQAAGLTVPQARVHINFWQSLRSWSLQFERITLTGARFHYDLREEALASDASLIDLVPRFLLNQLDHVVIADSVLEMTNLLGVQREIQIDRLSWSNQGTNHQGVGQLRIADVTDNALDVLIDINGNNPQELSGQVYVNAENIDIAPWLQRQFASAEVTHAEFNFTLWLNFSDSSFNDGVMQLQRNLLQWQSSSGQHQLIIPTGQFKLRPLQDGWLINNAPLTIELDQRQWQLPTFSLSQQAGHYGFSVQDVPLQELTPLLSLVGNEGDVWAQQLQQAEAQGKLDVIASLVEQKPWQWWLRADQLRWQEVAGVPAVDGLALTAYGQQQQFNWRVQGQQVTLNGEALNAADAWQLPQLDLRGDVKWGEQWRVGIAASSTLEIGTLPLRLRGSISPYQDDILLALSAQASHQQPLPISALRDHLPVVMGADLYDYLNTAIINGQMQDLAMVWRGLLKDFPYTNNGGVFHARTRVADFEFDFQRDWWPLVEAETLIDFRNERMHIRAFDGELGKMNLTQVDTIIPSLISAEPYLDIGAEIDGAAENLQPVFANSPLRNSVGSALTELQLTGAMSGDLSLMIPLTDNGEVVASGGVNLADNQLYIASIEEQFTNLNGRLNYRNDNIYAEQLEMRWQQQPLRVDIDGRAASDHYKVAAAIVGDWFVSEPDLVQGTLNWEADFDLILPDQGGYSFNWRQQSDLAGLAIELPTPLNKSAAATENWQLQVSGSAESILINSQLGTQALLELQLDGAGRNLQQGYLRVGEVSSSASTGNLKRLQANFPIELNLDEVVAEQWFEALQVAQQLWPDHAEGQQRLAFLQPDLIAVTANRMRLVDTQFDDATIFAWPDLDTDSWQFDFNAEQARLDGQINSTESVWQVAIDADFIEFSNVANDEIEDLDPLADVDYSQWPQVSLQCKRCRYGDYQLGQVQLQLEPSQNGFAIPELSFENDGHRLATAVQWNSNGDGLTRIQGEFSSDDVGEFLSDYDITSMIQDSSAEFRFDLYWTGSPTAYASESLNGQVSWNLGQGYLNEISDGGARIFSLLSLDGIFRKLRFDFRDVFANGLFFTEFGGDFGIQDGVVKTDNTYLNGAAGDMEVSGSSNLVSRELNYQLYFVPKVTSSLPVILAWMVNPPSGLAALLIDRVLHNAQVISRIEYRVTGTIDEPIVEEVARDSREVELPASEKKEPSNEQDSQPTTDSGTDDQSTGAGGQP